MKKGGLEFVGTNIDFYRRVGGILSIILGRNLTTHDLDVYAHHMNLPEEVRFTTAGAKKLQKSLQKSTIGQLRFFDQLSDKKIIVKVEDSIVRYKPLAPFDIVDNEVVFEIKLKIQQNDQQA